MLCGRPWSNRARGVTLAAAWLVTVAALWGAIVATGDQVAVAPRDAVEQAVLMVVAPLLAMLVGCAHFGWYLALMSALGYHNNELGGAARVDRYRQFIRFRVTADRLTGYVIGLDGVVEGRQRGDVLKPLLLDVFTIEPRRPAKGSSSPFDSRSPASEAPIDTADPS